MIISIAAKLATAYTKHLIANRNDAIYSNIKRALDDCPAIMRACNAHDDLVDACETVLANLKPVYTEDHIVIKKLNVALAKAKAVQ